MLAKLRSELSAARRALLDHPGVVAAGLTSGAGGALGVGMGAAGGGVSSVVREGGPGGVVLPPEAAFVVPPWAWTAPPPDPRGEGGGGGGGGAAAAAGFPSSWQQPWPSQAASAGWEG
jgi:hypothetical protein